MILCVDQYYDRFMCQKAFFLDRDGVLIEDNGYVYKTEDMVIRDSIIPLLRAAQERQYLLIIVTNQSGIGRGYYTEEDFWMFQERLVQELSKKGIHISASYFCPYFLGAPVSEYNRDSLLRKPAPGMILQAQKDFNLDLTRSIMIGDKESDMMEGIEGLKTFILKGKYPLSNSIPRYNSEEEILKELAW